MATLEEKVSALTALRAFIKSEEQRADELEHEIAVELISTEQTKTYGSDGIGYALHSSTHYRFPQAAYLAVNNLGLRKHFEQPLKITKTKLEDLHKSGDISTSEYAQIIRHMQTEEGAIGLRKIVDKDKVVK